MVAKSAVWREDRGIGILSKALAIPRSTSSGKHSDQGSEYTSIEVSSHVSGTKDRSAIVVWLPQKWGEMKKAVEKANGIFDSMDIGPVAFLSDGVRAQKRDLSKPVY